MRAADAWGGRHGTITRASEMTFVRRCADDDQANNLRSSERY